MGGNGSFSRHAADCEDGRQWKTVATCGKIQIIERKDRSKSNAMPVESHTPGRIYAMFRKDGKDVGSIAQYGRDGQKIWELHTGDHHFGALHYHKWEDKGNGNRGENKQAYELTKSMKKLLRQLRNFDKV